MIFFIFRFIEIMIKYLLIFTKDRIKEPIHRLAGGAHIIPGLSDIMQGLVCIASSQTWSDDFIAILCSRLCADWMGCHDCGTSPFLSRYGSKSGIDIIEGPAGTRAKIENHAKHPSKNQVAGKPTAEICIQSLSVGVVSLFSNLQIVCFIALKSDCTRCCTMNYAIDKNLGLRHVGANIHILILAVDKTAA